MKKMISMVLAAVLVLALSVPVLAEPVAPQENTNDIQEYLWEISADMEDEAFETARARNYKIINEWAPLFTEESFHAVYVANVHANQKKDGAPGGICSGAIRP